MTAKRAADAPNQRWHFDKRLSINTLVTIVGMATLVGGPVFVWGRAMESRVLALEIIQSDAKQIEISRRTDERESRTALTGRLDKVDEKLTQVQVQIGQLVVQLNLRDKPSGR